MFLRYIFSAAFILCAAFVSAQDPASLFGAGMESGSTLNVLYRHDASGRIFATPRGFGLSFKRAKHVTGKTRSFYEIESQNLRHPKENKITGNSPERRRFVYGKINNVLLLRGMVGMQNVIFSKPDHKAVEIRYSYSLGATMAFAKPYYVQVDQVIGNNYTISGVAVFDDDNFSKNPTTVTGRGRWTEGLPELKFYPAASAKFNLSFEYAPYTNLIRALEVGCSLDYFPKALPIMARNSAESVVFTFHVGFVFGKKWY